MAPDRGDGGFRAETAAPGNRLAKIVAPPVHTLLCVYANNDDGCFVHAGDAAEMGGGLPSDVVVP